MAGHFQVPGVSKSPRVSEQVQRCDAWAQGEVSSGSRRGQQGTRLNSALGRSLVTWGRSLVTYDPKF